MTTQIPDIQPRDKFSVSAAAKILGVGRDTLYRAIKVGGRRGGIDAHVRHNNGRLQITGREILRFWQGR